VVKRKDFNATLKQLTDCLERMCSGSRFHSDGAATAYATNESEAPKKSFNLSVTVAQNDQ